MSVAGLQKTQQLLQVIGQQLPSIAQASETPGVNLVDFIHGALARCGIPLESTGPMVNALVSTIGPPTSQQSPSVPSMFDTTPNPA